MRALLLTAALTAAIAAPAFAQTERGYIAGIGGFAVTPDSTTGAVGAEVGVRIAPRLLVFGNFGQFHNLQPSDLAPVVETTTTFLSAAQGLNVTSIARVPAWYSLGGLRYEVPVQHHLAPYAAWRRRIREVDAGRTVHVLEWRPARRVHAGGRNRHHERTRDRG